MQIILICISRIAAAMRRDLCQIGGQDSDLVPAAGPQGLRRQETSAMADGAGSAGAAARAVAGGARACRRGVPLRRAD